MLAFVDSQDFTALFTPGDLELRTLAVQLLVALLLGHVLGWHFVRFAPVMGHKEKLARVLVWIAATTLLIISVVKVSLPLSLGLVGALSVIRFRTPIKEPEELAYLFVAVAVGVGLGAERLWETVLVFTMLLAVMALRSLRKSERSALRTILHVTVPGAQAESPLPAVLALAEQHCERIDLRRVDRLPDEFQASLFVQLDSPDRLQALLDGLAATWSTASVSVVERGTVE